MLRCAERFRPGILGGGALIRQVKINKEIVTASWAEAMRRKDVGRHPLRRAPLARLDIVRGEDEVSVLLIPDDGAPVTDRRVTYAFGNHVRGLRFGDDGTTSGRMSGMDDTVDLMCGIEECFRDIIIEERAFQPGEYAIRWGYAENFPVLDNEEVSGITVVEFGRSQTLAGQGNGHFDIREGRISTTVARLRLQHVLSRSGFPLDDRAPRLA